jgi:hypothetical protein
MARLDDSSKKPQQLSFFKIHENSYDPKTKVWGSQVLLKQKEEWTVQIPSDIKPGLYVVRHEIISLHFAENLDPKVAPTEYSSTQVLPVCLNVEVIGSGTAAPEGVHFPGAYKPTDPGIKFNIYNMENKYIAPGPTVYQGKFEAPQGPQPVVKETGAITGAKKDAYRKEKDRLDKFFETAVGMSNYYVPGGGGCIWEQGADPKTAVCTPRNAGGAMNPDFKAMDEYMKKTGKTGMEAAKDLNMPMLPKMPKQGT